MFTLLLPRSTLHNSHHFLNVEDYESEIIVSLSKPELNDKHLSEKISAIQDKALSFQAENLGQPRSIVLTAKSTRYPNEELGQLSATTLGDILTVEILHVDPTARNQGVGKQLCSKIFEKANELGI